MKKYIIYLFILFCSSQVFGLSIWSADSLGLTTKNEKQYIIHEVEAGETLYALSRRYGTDVQTIKNENAQSVTSLNVGQKVLIPFLQSAIIKGDNLHSVKPSETLFSISRQYNVKVDDLKRWNNLTGNLISVGQQLIIKSISSETPVLAENNQMSTKDRKLHIVEQSQTLYSIAGIYGVSSDQLKNWNHLESNTLEIGQVLVVSASNSQLEKENISNSSMLPAAEKIDKKEEIDKVPLAIKTNEVDFTEAKTTDVNSSPDDRIIEKPVEKIVQKGFAEVIENTSETKKYLALHREAPTGTIMQVRNEMNSQSVFVRIVGKIPPTGDNSKVILKISQKAYDRLGAVDNRFPVEISYIP